MNEAEQHAKHLESEGFVKAAAELRRLSAINAELVISLEEVLAYCKEHCHDWMCMVDAKSALEKAKQ